MDAQHFIALQTTFQSLLPRIEQHGSIYFRHLRCPQTREDAIQEMRSLAWKWLIRLTKKGKDVNEFPITFVQLLARAVASGRRLNGMEKAKDALNPATQRRHGFRVENFDSSTSTSHERLHASPHGQEQQDTFEERLRDNTLTPIPDQVAFRIDFAQWRRSRCDRHRRIIDQMMLGDRTLDLSRKFGISPGRVSQLRREFHDEWQQFCGGSSHDATPV
jgi:hypothetical protein